MRPSIVAGLGVLGIVFVLSAMAVDGVEPAVYRPPEEARFCEVTLPSNSPMTVAGPPAALTPRDADAEGAFDDALGARGPGIELPLERPRPTATPRPAPRRTLAPTAWHHDPEASWYGPGFYGKRTACGLAMSQTLIGVAHRSFPCGTLVVFRHAGRTMTAPVVDRGPYVPGRIWDLTAGLAIALDHRYTGPIEWRMK